MAIDCHSAIQDTSPLQAFTIMSAISTSVRASQSKTGIMLCRYAVLTVLIALDVTVFDGVFVLFCESRGLFWRVPPCTSNNTLNHPDNPTSSPHSYLIKHIHTHTHTHTYRHTHTERKRKRKREKRERPLDRMIHTYTYTHICIYNIYTQTDRQTDTER